MDARRFVFVPCADQPNVIVVDSETDRIVATLPLGLLPRQVAVSGGEAKLVATDGKRAVIVDLAERASRPIDLPHPVARLVLGTTGWMLAAADPDGGMITLYDLRFERVVNRLQGLPALRDLMFSDKDGFLLVAAEGWDAISVVDVNTGRPVSQLAPFRPAPAGIGSLARTPNGRRVLARPQGGGAISVIDLQAGLAVGELDVAPTASGAVPSGTGALLFVPDSVLATLTVFRTDALARRAVLPGAPGLQGVYSAWLDSVAFVPSATRRRILVYDLDRLQPAGDIALAGTPGTGSVTADSRKLYLPLSDPARLAVIDGETRAQIAWLALPAPPLAAIAPGGWGVCH